MVLFILSYSYDYEGNSHIGVYSSLRKAVKAMKTHTNDNAYSHVDTYNIMAQKIDDTNILKLWQFCNGLDIYKGKIWKRIQ